MSSHQSDKITYEIKDIFVKGVGLSLVIFTVAFAIIFYASLMSYQSYNTNQKDEFLVTHQTNGHYKQDIKDQETLSTLKWISKKRGKVQIPIKDAMLLVVNEYN